MLILTLASWDHSVEFLFICWSNNSPDVWESARLGHVLKGSETTSSHYVPRGKEATHLFSTNPKAPCAPNLGNSLSRDLPLMLPFTQGITSPTYKKAEPLAFNTCDTLKTFGKFNLVCVVCKIHFSVQVGKYI